MTSKYIFNNEAIGVVAILAVLRECKVVSYSKSMLILPFLLHSQTNATLRRSNSVIRSSEEFIMKKLPYFGNFNSRFYSLLPITINSLMILREMGCIEINKNIISYNPQNKFDFFSREIGNRASQMIKASEKLADILLNEDDKSLYLKLRIQL